MKNRALAILATLAAAAAFAAAPSDTVPVEVKKVDKAAGKLTLKHGPLPNLGMGGMTMAFVARDPALVARVKEGDTVKATLTRDGNTYYVTAIEPAR